MSLSEKRLTERLQKHIQLLEAAVEAKTRELYQINSELEQRVADRTRELAELLAKAEAASAAKQTFLAHMSHELRTPLHAIGGMTEVLLSGSEGVDRRRLEVIRSAGEHMLKLVNQVLDLSWLQREEMPMHFEQTDITRLAEEAVSACDVPAAKKKLRVRACVGRLPPLLAVDAMRLKEVLLNFLGNSVKFTKRGIVTLSVEGRVEGHQYVLDWSVEDTGCGMDAATVARVFEPFFQARDTYRREHGGAGLGMAISRRIVQAMGGDVAVSSTPGVGTRVAFTTRHPAPAMLPESAGGEAAGGAVGGRRVLVIDDQEVNCLVAEAVLSQLGCSAAFEMGPAAGIAKALEETFDLLLVDYHMPEIDGCEVVARLRRAGVRTPILLATADLTTAAYEAAAAAGCDGILGKPFTGAELQQRMMALFAATDGQPPAVATVAPMAVAEPSAPPLFDLESALQRVGGNARVLRAVIGAFLTDLPGLLAALEAGGELRAPAHALKGSSATIGAGRLAELARAVEFGDRQPLQSGALRSVADDTAAALAAWLQG